LDAGVSETVIAMRVGHTSPALIRSTYGHLIGTVGQRAAEATASLVPRKAKTDAKNAKKAKKKAAKAKDREEKDAQGRRHGRGPRRSELGTSEARSPTNPQQFAPKTYICRWH
jgi:hypothetical protein